LSDPVEALSLAERDRAGRLRAPRQGGCDDEQGECDRAKPFAPHCGMIARNVTPGKPLSPPELPLRR
jgi:hypothetical protein